MKTFFTFIINTLYVLVIVFVVVSLSFAALSHKEQLAAQYATNTITGTVTKREVPVLAPGNGAVHTMKLLVGQRVKQNDVLMQITASQSADTKIKENVPQDITSPLQGVIEKVSVEEGYAVYQDSPLVTILSDEDMSVSVAVSDDEYHTLSKMDTITFYSPRLDQSFLAAPSVVAPSVSTDTVTNRTVTVSYTFMHPHEAISLLQGEQLQVLMPSQSTNAFLPITQLKSLLHL